MNKCHHFTLAELVIVIVLLVVLAGMLLPALNQPRGTGHGPNCAGNLKQIGLALIMYAGDDADGGLFPTGSGRDLGLLNAQKYLVDGRIYGCPSKDNPSSTASASDYVYLGAGLTDTNKNPTTTSLAYDASGNHPDNAWCNVLYLDGHVRGGKPE